jgi:hypothetical protein
MRETRVIEPANNITFSCINYDYQLGTGFSMHAAIEQIGVGVPGLIPGAARFSE